MTAREVIDMLQALDSQLGLDGKLVSLARQQHAELSEHYSDRESEALRRALAFGDGVKEKL